MTCVMDTASSSVDGATKLDRVVLILSQQTQQLKETPNERWELRKPTAQQAVGQKTPKLQQTRTVVGNHLLYGPTVGAR